MPVDYTGFTLKPVGFFDRNPALDVPPTEAEALPRVRFARLPADGVRSAPRGRDVGRDEIRAAVA